MSTRNILVFAVFLVVFLMTAVPYMQFIIQRNTLDTDIGMILLEFSTTGEQGFKKRLDRICQKALLEPGTYAVTISEDKNTSRVVVTVSYEANFKILFMEHTERVELVNATSNLGL